MGKILSNQAIVRGRPTDKRVNELILSSDCSYDYSGLQDSASVVILETLNYLDSSEQTYHYFARQLRDLARRVTLDPSFVRFQLITEDSRITVNPQLSGRDRWNRLKQLKADGLIGDFETRILAQERDMSKFQNYLANFRRMNWTIDHVINQTRLGHIHLTLAEAIRNCHVRLQLVYWSDRYLTYDINYVFKCNSLPILDPIFLREMLIRKLNRVDRIDDFSPVEAVQYRWLLSNIDPFPTEESRTIPRLAYQLDLYRKELEIAQTTPFDDRVYQTMINIGKRCPDLFNRVDNDIQQIYESYKVNQTINQNYLQVWIPLLTEMIQSSAEDYLSYIPTY